MYFEHSFKWCKINSKKKKRVFVAMEKYDVMSRDPGNENRVTPVIFFILIKLGTHTNKKFASNISLHTKVHSGLH